MKISVTRNTGWIGFAVRLKVFINGVEMAKVANAETQAVNIPLPAGDAAILTIKSLRTSSIQVQDGDQVLIETNPTYKTCFSIAIAILLISFFLRYSADMPSFLLSLVAFSLIIVTFFIQQFKLSKINQ